MTDPVRVENCERRSEKVKAGADDCDAQHRKRTINPRDYHAAVAVPAPVDPRGRKNTNCQRLCSGFDPWDVEVDTNNIGWPLVKFAKRSAVVPRLKR